MKLKIEQQPPDKPSFLTVVLLSGAAILVIFIIALFVLHLSGFHFKRSFRKHPTSQLVLPAPSSPTHTSA